MKCIISCALALWVGSTWAKAPAPDMQVSRQTDSGRLTLAVGRDDIDVAVTVVGPGGARHTATYAGNEAIVLDSAESDLPDGLYKYEIRPVAKVKRTPGEVPDHLRGLTDAGASKASPVSGSFRVRNGAILDSAEKEPSPTAARGIAQ